MLVSRDCNTFCMGVFNCLWKVTSVSSKISYVLCHITVDRVFSNDSRSISILRYVLGRLFLAKITYLKSAIMSFLQFWSYLRNHMRYSYWTSFTNSYYINPMKMRSLWKGKTFFSLYIKGLKSCWLSNFEHDLIPGVLEPGRMRLHTLRLEWPKR